MKIIAIIAKILVIFGSIYLLFLGPHFTSGLQSAFYTDRLDQFSLTPEMRARITS